MSSYPVGPYDLLVIGGSGFVGARAVQAAAEAGYRLAYTYNTHPLPLPVAAYHVDLVENAALEACIRAAQPRVVLYCAVPRGGEPIHRAVSVIGVQRTLASLEKVAPSALFVYVSTNSVFSGRNDSNREIDPPDPENRLDAYRAYALTRAEGEKVTLANWKNAIVVRTSNVDGRDIHGNLNPRLGKLVENFQKGLPFARFTNRLISPTLVDNITEAVIEIIGDHFSYRGILHIAGSQPLSDYEYALCLARHLQFDEALVRIDQVATSSASGVMNISLDVAFTQSLLTTRLLNVREQLTRLFPDTG
jgi:dTDP-4-dehydrorhamnose reductase